MCVHDNKNDEFCQENFVIFLILKFYFKMPLISVTSAAHHTCHHARSRRVVSRTNSAKSEENNFPS